VDTRAKPISLSTSPDPSFSTHGAPAGSIERIDLPVIIPKKLRVAAAAELARLRALGADIRPANDDTFDRNGPTAASTATPSTDPARALAPAKSMGVRTGRRTPSPTRTASPTPKAAPTTGPTASGPTAIRANMPQHDQGWSNACGTTSLAMVLEYFGIPADHESIDRAIRPWGDMGPGVSPDDLVGYARRAGLQSQQYSNGSIADLEGHVAAGRPVTVLIAHPESGGAHYVNITAIEHAADGSVFVHIRDPNGFDRRLPEAEFLRLWTDVRLWQPSKASSFGELVQAAMPNYNRAYIVYDRVGAAQLPAPNLIDAVRDAPAGTVLSGVNGLAAGGRMIANGDVGAGALELVGSTLNTVAGGAGYLVGNLMGRNLETLGDSLLAKGEEMLAGNVLEKVGGAILTALGGLAKALGWLLSCLGGLISTLGSIPGDLLDRAARALTSKEELRQRLLDRPADQAPAEEVLARASLTDKMAMLETLLEAEQVAAVRDQQAALVVLRACDERQRREIAERFGGAEALANRFDGERQTEVRKLLEPSAANERKAAA
jgi:hypothetical protein